MSAFHETFHFILHCFLAKKRHGIHSPLVYQLSDSVFSKNEVSEEITKLRALKNQWKNDRSFLEINDFGAGTRSSTGRSLRSVSDIAKISTADDSQAQYLFQLASYLKPKAILELGTNLGWTTMHFASACPHAKIETIEGSESLYQFSTARFKELEMRNITSHLSEFGALLRKENWSENKFDLVYLDGNHRKQPTLEYCHLLQNNLSPNAVIIVDDIYWSKEMTEAWKELIEMPPYSLTIDCFYFGLLFLEKRNQKEHFKLRI